MGNKLILIGIAIAAIGLVALPQTLALFSGQHNWYDISPAGNQVPCQKCHADIAIEMSIGDGTTANGIHRSIGCESCHIKALTDQGSTIGGPITNDIHAAASPACLDCHDGSGAGDARSILNGSEEVHKPFAKQANDSLLLKGSNEACIACHTHVAVQINWTRAYMISFSATENANTGTHDWIVDNFAAEGTAVIRTYGNQSGERVNYTQPPDISVNLPSGWFDENNP